jgi:hypothetical protein
MSKLPFPHLSPEQLAILQTQFDAIRPQIETHGRIYFRHVRCKHRLADLIAEMLTLGWQWFVRLMLRGKDPRTFLAMFNKRLGQHIKCGRRVCGKEKAGDVMSSSTQQQEGFVVQSLPTYDTGVEDNEAIDALRDNTKTPPPDQVQFRLDFPAWRLTRCERDRRVIDELMQGERTLDVSNRHGLSPGRISQLRREFCHDYARFCGDDE